MRPLYHELRNTAAIEITDDQLAAVNLTGDTFHPEWNYKITPALKRREPLLAGPRALDG